MSKVMSKSRLAIVLSGLEGFLEPKVRQEQYLMDSEIAASVLWNAYLLGDIESKMIRWAINTATKKPYVVIILTSEEKIKDYLENKHYSNGKVKSAVKISSGQEALQIIDIVSRT